MKEQRIEFVLLRQQGAGNVSQLCQQFGISRQTGYRWLNRYERADNVMELGEQSRRPLCCPHQTAEAHEERVVALRQRYGWGGRKLKTLLEGEGIALAEATINRILVRRGLIEPWNRHSPAVRRFEREQCNSLWQMDGKGQYRLEGGWCYPLSILDDHSRFAVGLYALPRWESTLIWPCLEQTFERYGVPEQMLMDHGVPWWSMNNGHGLTQFSVKLIEQGIRLLHGRVYHPQTQGKVERFHRTLNESVHHQGRPRQWEAWPPLLAEFREQYNQIRPHEALGMKPPASCYEASSRAYQAEPPEWIYPTGSIVRRLNASGCLEYQRQRWFVCEALAGKQVRLQILDGRILVSFRHLHVREIFPEQQRTVPVVLLATDNGGC